jgi:hypothetical protein
MVREEAKRDHGSRHVIFPIWNWCILNLMHSCYLTPCGVNLDDLNILLHGFIPLICKFGQNLGADKIWGRALGSLLRRGRTGRGERTSYCPKGTIWDTIRPLALEML